MYSVKEITMKTLLICIYCTKNAIEICIKVRKKNDLLTGIPVCSKVKLDIEIMNGLFQKEQMQTF